MQTISEICKEACYYPGYTLFEDGEPAKNMYVLVDGEIDLFFAIGETGSVKIDQVEIGEVFGCSALVPPYIQTSTARANSRIEILELDTTALRKLILDEPHLGVTIQQNVIKCLLERIIDFQLG
jgi:CRP-like cAMP-binding protein